ncbi:MAG: triose-phosphate isomerase, partial [Chloroflexi bacterium]|nr:triose-phosphate isomerase [Chloroflexota bacterium]
YEPVWAIGTGLAARGPDANQSMGLIRELLAGLYGNDFAQATPILYGGSVKSDNIAEFAGQPEIDGGLVGGASLKAEEFLAIVKNAVAARKG